MNRRVQHSDKKKGVKKGPSATRNKPSAKKSTRKQGAFAESESFSRSKVSEYSQSFGARAWLDHHRFSCLDSGSRLLAMLGQSIMTWLVIAIALVLPSMLYLGVQNVQQLGEGWQNSSDMSAYISLKAKPLAIEQLQQRLLLSDAVESIVLVTPEQAKQEFLQTSGLGSVLQSLDDNPLPAVLLITPSLQQNQVQQLERLRSTIAAEPLIDSVEIDLGWLARLQQMMLLAQRLVVVLSVLLGGGVLLVIVNTIRLAIENRRNEIVVVKMVGATNGFVQRPFLYTGFWYGAGGGSLALLMLMGAGLWLNEPIQRLIDEYQSDYLLTWVSLNFALFLLGISAFIGWLGAWLAVARHLKHIEPS